MLILFFKRNVDRIVFHKELPPGLILGLNPVFMIILGVFLVGSGYFLLRRKFNLASLPGFCWVWSLFLFPLSFCGQV